MFFTSLITPAILLVLYVTFLGNVYKDSLTSAFPEGFTLPESLIDGIVATCRIVRYGCLLFQLFNGSRQG